MQPPFQCSEEKKAEFRKYLEKHNVIDAITGMFDKIILTKEKPENPIDLIRQELGVTPMSQETLDKLEQELDEAYREIRRLRQEVIDMGLGKVLEEKDKLRSLDGGPSCPDC